MGEKKKKRISKVGEGGCRDIYYAKYYGKGGKWPGEKKSWI